jgi:hypothetical protein
LRYEVGESIQLTIVGNMPPCTAYGHFSIDAFCTDERM